MNKEEKKQIVIKLGELVKLKGSQNKLANTLKISSATLSQMLNGNWDLIKDEMWRDVAAQIGIKRNNWNIVETANFKKLHTLFQDAV